MSLNPPKGSSGGGVPLPPGFRPRPLPSPGDGVCLAETQIGDRDQFLVAKDFSASQKRFLEMEGVLVENVKVYGDNTLTFQTPAPTSSCFFGWLPLCSETMTVNLLHTEE